jgi:hypothetical protein
MKTICQIYSEAQELQKKGIKVISTDEKTGIQAIERKRMPMKPALVEKQESEYIRHGTKCLISNLEVATGKIIAPSIGDSRTELDFLEHIKQTVKEDESAEWIFVVDQLNTHQSASLVEWVAKQCQYQGDLGKKGVSGILKNMESRAWFLQDSTHRIRFVYTPKHASWLNQIECWFSILVRRLIKRNSFSSTLDLQEKILNFIDYFNETMAKPFKWTYKGKPLQV